MRRYNDVIGRNEYPISTFSFFRIYCSLGIFTAIFVYIHASLTEIWKKMWVGVFSEHSVYVATF